VRFGQDINSDSTIELKENTVIVVLGASGDLAKKKTFPALFGLVSQVLSATEGPQAYQ
jgi:glucose-6-phosphate 1-dehydrogenase